MAGLFFFRGEIAVALGQEGRYDCRIPYQVKVSFSMRGLRSMRGGAVVLSLLLAVEAGAKVKVEDFPLRVHLFETKGTATYVGGQLDHTHGNGIGNLFENGEPKGFQFEYNCGEELHMTDGYETYPAKWKKAGGVLQIVTPVVGKPNAFHTCELKVVLKQGSVFVASRGANGVDVLMVNSPPFKAWMVKEGYDPEHGKSVPGHPLILNGAPVQ